MQCEGWEAEMGEGRTFDLIRIRPSRRATMADERGALYHRRGLEVPKSVPNKPRL